LYFTKVKITTLNCIHNILFIILILPHTIIIITNRVVLNYSKYNYPLNINTKSQELALKLKFFYYRYLLPTANIYFRITYLYHTGIP